MEAGAFFLLIIALIVIAALGGGVYLLAMRLRARKLHPAGDKAETTSSDSGNGASTRHERPEHVEVDSEQRARFIGTR